MKKVQFTIIAFLMILCSCMRSEQTINSAKKSFEKLPSTESLEDKEIITIVPDYNGLTGEEEIKVDYEKNNDPNSNYIDILVYAYHEGESRLIARLSPKNRFGHAIVTSGRVYYLYGDPIHGGSTKIKYLDLNQGAIFELSLNTFGTYCVSTDNQFVLYQKRGAEYRDQWGTLYIPVLIVRNLSNDKEYTYDFSDSFLRDGFGVTVSSNYLNDVNAFYIEFSQDAPGNIGKGYIHLDSMKFELLEE